MHSYEACGHAYHATLPTYALRTFLYTIQDTAGLGF